MTTPWVQPAVKNFLSYFGKTKKPRIAVRNASPDDLVRVAHKIYNDELMWFETDLEIIELPNDEVPEISVAYLDPADFHEIKIPKKLKMIITGADADKNYIFNLGYQNVADESGYQIWVKRGFRRG